MYCKHNLKSLAFLIIISDANRKQADYKWYPKHILTTFGQILWKNTHQLDLKKWKWKKNTNIDWRNKIYHTVVNIWSICLCRQCKENDTLSTSLVYIKEGKREANHLPFLVTSLSAGWIPSWMVDFIGLISSNIWLIIFCPCDTPSHCIIKQQTKLN